MSRRATLALVACVVVVGALAVAGGLAWRARGPSSELGRAVAMAPADTVRLSWTDWAGVRRELGSDVGPASSGSEVDDLMTAAFEADLSAMSALGSSAGVMQQKLGLSPATLEWELLAQAPGGAVEVLAVGEDLPFDELADRLRSLGWAEPAEADGVWEGGPEVLAGVGPGLTPELQHLALLEERGLVVASDQASYLERSLAAVTGDTEGADALADLADRLGGSLAAAVQDGAYACEELAMAQADDGARAEADQLVAAAGGIHPLTGFAMGRLAGGDVRAVLEVEDADDAPGDAEARAQLAAGPAPGQGGDFTDRFSVVRARTEGRATVLDLEPVDGAYVLSDLTSGPVLFATC